MTHNTLLFDAHVHIYPNFNIDLMIQASLENMDRIISQQKLDPDTKKMWLLTEGTTYNGFNDLLKYKSNKFCFNQLDEQSIVIRDLNTNADLLFVLAGRQIVTSNKLEICALATDFNMKDREYNTADTIIKVRENGAVAALNWAPGKWLFKRGKIVQKIIETNNHNELLVSETTMRPTIWSTPVLMKKAFSMNYKCVSGSDPLPFDGEEKLTGSLTSCMQGDFDVTKPAESVRSLLLDPNISITQLGKRSGPLTFAKRQYKIMNYNK